MSRQPSAMTRLLPALGALMLASCARSARQADLRPIPAQNVLLITIDTLRADALGSYGGPAATPALDRLAAEGVRFDFAHAHAVTTLTSHASILTGTYPFQHGIRDNSGYRLAPTARAAAAPLKSAGYRAGRFHGADRGDAVEERRLRDGRIRRRVPAPFAVRPEPGIRRLRRPLRRDARAD